MDVWVHAVTLIPHATMSCIATVLRAHQCAETMLSIRAGRDRGVHDRLRRPGTGKFRYCTVHRGPVDTVNKPNPSLLPTVPVEFTAQVYADTFTQLAKRSRPDVLYPVIKHLPPGEIPASPKELTPYCDGYDTIFLSLNRFGSCSRVVSFSGGVTHQWRVGGRRYERKKNITLALSALQHFKQLRQQQTSGTDASKDKKVLLVVAGGYDVRVAENVEYLKVQQMWCWGSQCFRMTIPQSYHY